MFSISYTISRAITIIFFHSLPNIVELLDCSGFFMFSSHRSLEKIEDLKACNKLRRLGDVSELAHVKILVRTRYTEGYLSSLLRWRFGTTLALLPLKGRRILWRQGRNAAYDPEGSGFLFYAERSLGFPNLVYPVYPNKWYKFTNCTFLRSFTFKPQKIMIWASKFFAFFWEFL